MNMNLFGPRWPLSKGNKDTFDLYEDVKQQINFYLKNLLLTSPGENISDPGYGVGIRGFLFEMNDESTMSDIRSIIAQKINLYIPYIRVEEIFVGASSADIDSNRLNVKIAYSIPGDVIQTVFSLDIKPENKIGFY